MSVEAERITKLNAAPDRPDRRFVLYWAQMNRRVDANHGLLYAAELANQHKLPVLVYEGLTCSYQYANDRLHTFILEAVPETARRLKKLGIGYVFYLRRTGQSRNDVLYELARQAAAVVTDDYPTFIARTHNRRVPEKLDVSYYVVDSSCIVPTNCIPRRQYGAYTIRPRINRLLPTFLKPTDKLQVKHRFTGPSWDFHTEVTGKDIPALVAACEIDHTVAPIRKLPRRKAPGRETAPLLPRTQSTPLRPVSQRAFRTRDLTHEPVLAFRADLVAGDRACREGARGGT